MAEEVTLEFLARQIGRVLDEHAAFRDEVRVQSVLINRLDVTLSIVVEEMRAIRMQIARMNDRIRQLEESA